MNRHSPLKVLGYGASRIVFDLGGREVLKVLYSGDATQQLAAQGINPNLVEAATWRTTPAWRWRSTTAR